MTDGFILSNFGSHFFLCDYTDNTTVPASGTEVENVISYTPPELSKDTKAYKTLTNNGWDSIAVLGQSAGDISLSFIRDAKGVYTGRNTDTDSYTVLKKWFDSSLGASAGLNARKNFVAVKPRLNSEGTAAYEGTLYHVIPKNWSDGPSDPDNGQEFNITLAVFQAPVPVVVTATENSFTFAAVA